MTLQQAVVAFALPEGMHTALQELDLTLSKGEWLAIVGANGSGKSTLARVAAGLLPLSSGTIQWTPDCKKAVVMQRPGAQLIGETIAEDVRFGLYLAGLPASEHDQLIRTSLEKVGLHVDVRQAIGTLSGGQQQLVAIAGCLATGANLLILDEPTAMLDDEASCMVKQSVQSLHASGVTILWITHRLEELANADRVLALSDARVVFAGDIRDFFYGTAGEAVSPCEQLQFPLPYVIAVARELQQLGWHLSPLPLTPVQLAARVAEGMR